MSICQAIGVFDGVHIHSCGNGGLWFRPYGASLFQTPKSKQKASPQAYGPSLRLGVPSLRYPSGGIALRLASLQPTCDGFDCVERRWRANPQINTSTLPPEGAGGSRSRSRSKAKASLSGVFLASVGSWAIRNARVFLFCDRAAGSRGGFRVAENVDYLPRVSL
jgi:hypothetical protein